MQFDIARQPLVPAFLTLLALAVTAVCVAPPAEAAAPLPAGAPLSDAAGLALPMPGELLARFESAHPVWAKAAAVLALLVAGTTTGRFTIRYNLYSVGTCAAIPLVGIIACSAAAEGCLLAGFAATALMALSVKNFCRAYRSGYSFDALFRASLYLGALVLLAPAALPFVLLLPTAAVLFDRTLRELLVAGAGLLLMPLLLCYVNWGAGGNFTAPLAELAGSYAGIPCEMLRSRPPLSLLLPGGALLCSLVSLYAFFTDIYAVGNKQRSMLLFDAIALLVAVLQLCSPAAAPRDLMLLAVPAAVSIPYFLVRTRRFLSSALYLLLLAGTLLSLLL